MKNLELDRTLRPSTIQAKGPLQETGADMLPNLMHSLPGIAYRCQNDANWTMLYVSEGCRDLTGYKVSELLHNASMSFEELIFPQDRKLLRESIDEAISRRLQYQAEYRIKTKSGEIKWVWEKGNAVYDKNNSPVYLDGFITDITARKKMEEDLKRMVDDLSELNATKDHLFPLLAHDLQNPVYAIISLSEFVADNYQRFEQQELEDTIMQVNSAARGIFTLLENLLDWASLQTDRVVIQKEMVSLGKATEYAIEHYQKAAEQKLVKIEFVQKEDVMVESDLKMISSILRNLISNALKYSYPEGKVIVKLDKRDDEAVISVQDFGVGIPRQHLPRLFRIDSGLKRYGTVNEGGSGLGLVLVQNYAKILEARVSVESRLGSGSTFTLVHPWRI